MAVLSYQGNITFIRFPLAGVKLDFKVIGIHSGVHGEVFEGAIPPSIRGMNRQVIALVYFIAPSIENEKARNCHLVDVGRLDLKQVIDPIAVR